MALPKLAHFEVVSEMKKILVVAAVATLLAGCTSSRQTDRAIIGGSLGAATGVIVGAAVGAGAAPVIAGAALGAAGGAAIGAATTPN
ncbi:bacteriocin [Roseibium sp. HPY-6]|uniref:bacteriocin n=1 Tax=Roseibium sp. HPY-6 TaxID=3229852 RepID=UPI00338E8596